MTDVALRFTAIDAGLSAGFKKINDQLADLEKNSQKSSQSITSSFNGLKTAIGGIALLQLTGQVIEFAEQVTAASIRTGIAAEEIQKLQFIAGQADVDFDQITGAINKFQRQLVEGGKNASEGLRTIGTSLDEIKQLSPDKQFERIAEGITAIEDPAERVAVSVQLFGKAGAELLPVLTAVGSQAEALGIQFDALGGAVSADAIANVDDLGDSFTGLKDASKSLGVELLSLVSGPLEGIARVGAAGVGAIRRAIQDAKTATQGGTKTQELDLAERALSELKNTGGFTAEGSFIGDDVFKGLVQKAEERVNRLRDEFNALKVQDDLDKALTESLKLDDPLKFLGDSKPKIPGISDADQAAAKKAAEQAEEDRLKQAGIDRAFRATQELSSAQQLSDGLVEIAAIGQEQMLANLGDFTAKSIAIRSDGELFLEGVRETFGLQEIKFEEIKSQSILGIASGLFGALAAENSKLAKVQKAIALAQTIYFTATGIASALRLPFPASIAAAAKVAAVGAIQIAKIKSTNYGGGGDSAPTVGGSGGSASEGSSAAASSGSSALAQDQSVTQQRAVQVIFSGSMYGLDDFKKVVVDTVKGAVDGQDVIVISPNSRNAQEIRAVPV